MLSSISASLKASLGRIGTKIFGRTARNIGLLYGWQAAQYLVPLLTLPYLTRVLGPDQFGLMAIATNLVGYLMILTDWGFALTANQQIAQARSDPDAIRPIFWNTFIARGLLGMGGILLFLPIIAVVPSLRGMSGILLVALVQVFGQVLTVHWYLQGAERMAYFVTASMIGRLATVPATFLLVNTTDDAAVAVAIQSAAVCLTGISSLFLALRNGKLWPVSASPKGIWNQLQEGWHVFLSTAAITLYTQSNIVVTGFVVGPVAAGLFSGADRLKRALQSLIGPVSTTLFPRINVLMADNPGAAIRMMLRLLLIQGSCTLCLSVGAILLSDWLVLFLLGDRFANATPVMQLLSATLFLIGLSNVLGVQMMLPLGMKKQFSRILLMAGIVNVTLLFPLAYYFEAMGTAIAVVITEAFITAAMALIIFKNRAGLVRKLEEK